MIYKLMWVFRGSVTVPMMKKLGPTVRELWG